MQGFILGLTNGTACLASCAPIIIPYLLSEADSVKSNTFNLILFLSGRLIGYIFFGLLAWVTNKIFIQNTLTGTNLLSISYIVLGLLLITYTLRAGKRKCNLKAADAAIGKHICKKHFLYPVLLGIFTGINVCPPFLLAFTEAVAAQSIFGSIFFFITFFIGTSLYFIPLPLIGGIKKMPELRIVGELASYILAVYYLSKGAIVLGGILYEHFSII